VNIHELPQHIPMQNIAVKGSGLLGGSSAFAGFVTDMSQWTELAQILANLGIFIGGVTAFITLGYSMYKGRSK
jgi:hypothetical protein